MLLSGNPLTPVSAAPLHPQECDDGNTVGGDGCDAACVREFCGNGVVDNGGAEVSWAGSPCAGLRRAGATQLRYSPCGVGCLLASTQACDDGNSSNSDGCLTTCEVATCGDGWVQDGVEGACSGVLPPSSPLGCTQLSMF